MEAIRTPPRLNAFAVYNAAFGPTDETQHQQILYYYSASDGPRASGDTKLRQVGLAQALVSFSSVFAGERTCESVHTRKTRLVVLEPEPRFCMLLNVALPYITRSVPEPAGDSVIKQTVEHLDGELNDACLQGLLSRVYRLFRLFHGRFTMIWQKQSVGCLRQLLREFYDPRVSRWEFDRLDLFDAINGIFYQPLNHQVYSKVHALAGELRANFPAITRMALLWRAKHLAWADLHRQEDVVAVYDALVEWATEELEKEIAKKHAERAEEEKRRKKKRSAMAARQPTNGPAGAGAEGTRSISLPRLGAALSSILFRPFVKSQSLDRREFSLAAGSNESSPVPREASAELRAGGCAPQEFPATGPTSSKYLTMKAGLNAPKPAELLSERRARTVDGVVSEFEQSLEAFPGVQADVQRSSRFLVGAKDLCDDTCEVEVRKVVLQEEESEHYLIVYSFEQLATLAAFVPATPESSRELIRSTAFYRLLDFFLFKKLAQLREAMEPATVVVCSSPTKTGIPDNLSSPDSSTMSPITSPILSSPLYPSSLDDYYFVHYQSTTLAVRSSFIFRPPGSKGESGGKRRKRKGTEGGAYLTVSADIGRHIADMREKLRRQPEVVEITVRSAASFWVAARRLEAENAPSELCVIVPRRNATLIQVEDEVRNITRLLLAT